MNTRYEILEEIAKAAKEAIIHYDNPGSLRNQQITTRDALVEAVRKLVEFERGIPHAL